uniref:Uncharacterized protein n=1 Tax=Ralstonia syzygii R24 TaxID=907261 RepID=G3A9F4_9RALS|nr:hypothetical protein RALSY_mp10440 [Ralstonia syzygii R24]
MLVEMGSALTLGGQACRSLTPGRLGNAIPAPRIVVLLWVLYPQTYKKIYFRLFCEVASFALTSKKHFGSVLDGGGLGRKIGDLNYFICLQ